MKKRCSQIASSTVLLCLAAYSAWSQSTRYSDRPSFWVGCQSIPGIQQAIKFQYLESSEFGPALTISNVTFTGNLVLSYTSIPGAPSSGPWEQALFNFDSGVPLGIHFANGARAFGADFSSDVSLYHSSFTATVLLNTGEQLSFTAPASPNSRFFGFISPTPFTDITFSDGGIFPITPGVSLHEEKIGNLYMVLEIPEPGSAVLLAWGAAALLWRRRTASHTS